MTGRAIIIASCATRPQASDDPRDRPLEERCVRAHPGRSFTKPGLTHEEVQAEARAAARRGELDKACDWL